MEFFYSLCTMNLYMHKDSTYYIYIYNIKQTLPNAKSKSYYVYLPIAIKKAYLTVLFYK